METCEFVWREGGPLSDTWLVIKGVVVVATQRFLEFAPRKFGEMIQFDEHIFQMGGSTTNQR